MTTHDRDKIIAIAEEVKANNDMFGDFSVALYAIAFEDGRQAEREECAQYAETFSYMSENFMALAEEIRARGEGK